MTATDQAFIRIFDTGGQASHAAPHVLFAARGVQLNTELEPVIVPHAGSNAAREAAREIPRPANRSPEYGEAEARSMAATTSRAREPRGGVPGREADTYLPSAYRSFVEVNGPTAQPQQQEVPSRPAVKGETQRRPIAEVIRTKPPVPPLIPALEVDALRWPRVVVQMLQQCQGELSALGEALETARECGRRVIVFHSTAPSLGCTTLLLAAARRLAERGRSVAIVDAELLRPQLAAAVGLALEQGWEATLLAGEPLAEAVIRSLAEGLAIVPLAAPFHQQQVRSGELIDQAVSALRMLAEHFDLVLVDAGCLAAAADVAAALQSLFTAAADGSVLVCTGEAATSDRHVLTSEVAEPLVAVIENLSP